MDRVSSSAAVVARRVPTASSANSASVLPSVPVPASSSDGGSSGNPPALYVSAHHDVTVPAPSSGHADADLDDATASTIVDFASLPVPNGEISIVEGPTPVAGNRIELNRHGRVYRRGHVEEEARAEVIRVFQESPELPQYKIARICRVSESTVCRWLRQYRETGAVKPRPRGSAARLRSKRTNTVSEWLRRTIEQQPDLHLDELQSKLDTELNIKVSVSTLSRWLQKMQLVRQRLMSDGMICPNEAAEAIPLFSDKARRYTRAPRDSLDGDMVDGGDPPPEVPAHAPMVGGNDASSGGVEQK